jgi:putative transposase
MSNRENSAAEHKFDIPDSLLDQLLSQVDSPSELVGSNGLLRALTARLVEKGLNAELDEHLGYEKGARRPSSNARNGSTPKSLLTEAGKVAIRVPRDREGSFEPQLVSKHQRRLEGFDERIIGLYSRGLSVREIQDFFREAYGAEVSAGLVSKVTDAVLEDVEAWRSRRLDPVYPIVYLDGLVVKVRQDGVVDKRTIYVALGVNMEGKKEVLGLYMAGTEGAKFWLQVITELKNRGVDDILIACCDGLKGFPEAIEAVFPHTVVQTCIVHMVRNSMRFVSYGARRKLARGLKAIYRADTLQQAEAALDAFEVEYGAAYPAIVRSWRANWDRVTPFFEFGPDIRRAIYTTNAIEALNRQLRKVLKTKGPLPTEDAAMKLLWLALRQATARWSMPIKKWDLALQQLAIRFEGRLTL